MTIALLFPLRTCIVQIQNVWVNFARSKRLFSLLAEAINSVCNVALCVRCVMFLLKIKQIHFSCRWVKGFTFLKRAQNQFKMFLEVSIVLAREKCEYLDGYVTTPRSIYACGKCRAWLFVHKVLFMLQEHVKTTKTDKTRLFFARKR